MLSFRIPSFISSDIIFSSDRTKCKNITDIPPHDIGNKTLIYNSTMSPYGYIDKIVNSDDIDTCYALWELLQHFDIITSDTSLSYICDNTLPIYGFIHKYYNMKIYPNKISRGNREDFISYCMLSRNDTSMFENWYADNSGLDSVIILNETVLKDDHIYHSIIADILMALIRQCIGGSLVIELSEITSIFSVDMIYILTHFYDDVFIVKPNIAETYRTEKFIFCYGFRGVNKKNDIYNMTSLLGESYGPNSSIIHNKIPHTVLKTLTNAISICENIKLSHINTNKSNDKKKEIQLDTINGKILSNCINWCKKNNIQIKMDIRCLVTH